MADNKKYYYIRLKENFFDSDEIKLLESIPNDGYKFSNILLKMYLKSLKYNGRLMFNERIPFNAEMLATVTSHSLGDVTRAIDMFKKFGLIEVLETGEIYMLDIQSFIGKTTTEADRKRSYRKEIEDKKALGTNVRQNSDKSIPEIEKELDIEQELNIELDTEKDTPYSKIVSLFENNGFGSVGGITSQNIQDELRDFADNSDVDEATSILKKAIEIAVNNGKNSFSYVWGITKRWYNSGIFTIEALEAEEKKRTFSKGYGNTTKKEKLENGGYGTR
ncbi:replication protein [Leuconostoc mesenteroides subsp. dextranicum]|uniref:phage replisome organizer N-terminal domain-containing protein n=1 Tax=Leuconostoc mesenteroides TaxID=1245 RepID=UPI000680FCF2|nr:phage replisome organizer N-terminal domain-containing protein [Leuconostoc mesenteroides]KMY79561.1 replication protein [Leuconostoc mesenteroides subsp. dextranicum]